MATNTLVPATWVARKQLSILHMKASAAARVDRDYEKDFMPIAGNYRAARPLRFACRSNADRFGQCAFRAELGAAHRVPHGESTQHRRELLEVSSAHRTAGDFAEQVLEPACRN